MKFGISLVFSNPGRKMPERDFALSQIDQATLAEKVGFDHVWVADHHGSEHYLPSALTSLAVIATRTKKIRIGTYIIVLPLLHPLLVAEQAALVDLLSNGRFDLGMGVGNFREEFDAIGVSPKERASRMEEGIRIIAGLWENESFSFEGKHFSFENFALNPRPIQKKAPIWLAGNAPAALDRAARFGYHLAGSGSGFDLYEQKLREYGRDPKDFNKAILTNVVLAETREEAWRRAGPPVINFLSYYKSEFDQHPDFEFFRRKPGGYFGVDPLPDPRDVENLKKLTFLGSPLIVGTPEDAIEPLEKIRAMGITHPVLSQQFGGMPSEHSADTIRLFGEKVIPHFR